MRRIWLLAACAAVGCADSPDRFGVNLIVDASPLAQTDRDNLAKLAVNVSGAESFDTVLDLTGVMDKTTLNLHYVPGVHAGDLTFTTSGRTSDDTVIAAGASTAITLVDGHTVDARVQLVSGGAMRHVGDACSSPTDLCDGAGGCVDGVCCGMPCTGACVACNTPGALGLCVPVGASKTPQNGHGSCDAQPSTTCGHDGTCDGAGNCRDFPLGTMCGAPSCTLSTNLFVAGGECDGSGNCVSPAPLTCDPYRCEDTTQCYSSCTNATQCTGSPPTCNTAVTPGSCGPKPNGAVCTQDAECQSMHCVEPDGSGNGICCDTTCTSTCMSCRLAATRGKCSLVPSGQDPFTQCPVGTGAQAACIPGGCDGSAAKCKLAPTTTQCAAPSCLIIFNSQLPAETCNADGTCPAQPSQDCSPYKCGATACKTTCTSDSDCITGTCVGGKCATFGGAYVANAGAPCTNACQDSNVLDGAACGCAAPYDDIIMLPSYNDCVPATTGASTIGICQRYGRTTFSDWGGAFATYTAGCGTSTTNPYTSAANCPSDTVQSTFFFYQTPCNGTSTLTFCTSMTAATVTYAGAYQLDDDVGQGTAARCRVPNPKTTACTCPAGTNAQPIRVLVDRRPATPGIIGSNIYYCTP